MLQDLHNHTIWSDGDNSIEEIYQNAVKYNVDEIGISDHYHEIKDFEGYLNDLKKYPVKKSVEIMATHVLQKLVDIDWCNKNLDYVILENFMNPKHIPTIIANFSVPLIIAHPEYTIIPHIIGMGISFEINLSIPLPSKRTLRQIARNWIKVTVGSDIHNLFDYTPKRLEIANKVAKAVNIGYVPKWYENY